MEKTIRDHFKKHDLILYAIYETIGFIPLKKADDYFLFLIESIVSQQLSIKASDTIFARLQKLFKEGRVTPQDLLSQTEENLRSAGLSRTKVTYMKDLAKKVLEKEINLDTLAQKTDQEVTLELTRVKGIGIWTAEMFLMSALGREDVFSYGDLGLRRAIEKLYTIPAPLSKETAEKISLKWSPYRSYACRILWRSLAT